MSIRLLATISAMTIATAFTVNAQTPTPQTQPRPQTETPTQRPTSGTQDRANSSDQAVTVTGCLQAEKDVPGRRESATERAGMGEDFVLTNVKMSQGASTSGLGLATMYQIKGGSLNDAELKKHLGHQVEITGRLDNNNSGMRGMSGTSGAGTTGATGSTSATGTTGTRGTTGTTGTRSATGTTAASATGRTSSAAGGAHDNNSNLPNLAATSLKMVSANCQAQ